MEIIVRAGEGRSLEVPLACLVGHKDRLLWWIEERQYQLPGTLKSLAII